MAMTRVVLRIKRQDGPTAPSRWEEFHLSYKPRMNVISALMDIRRNPVTVDGKKTMPVFWDCNCLEEVCGACSMIVNGKVRQACSALVDQLVQPIVLEPMIKFPLVRDLMVDRRRMFEALKRVRAWIPLDGTYNLGSGPRVDPETGAVAYSLSRCMTCGCCLEVCPQVTPITPFMGAAAISQVRLFNMHPIGRMNARERLDALMGEGGLADCANAQNCVHACPKEIPLTESIAAMGREMTRHMLKRLLGG
ncbi:MAG: succinate dehydrogenase iron-sulfur subunit [candidate division NC10 bacterium]|nr:succinate dehydrogenase iron-sulfur subunit [candidate division NC10 bacterium]